MIDGMLVLNSSDVHFGGAAPWAFVDPEQKTLGRIVAQSV